MSNASVRIAKIGKKYSRKMKGLFGDAWQDGYGAKSAMQMHALAAAQQLKDSGREGFRDLLVSQSGTMIGLAAESSSPGDAAFVEHCCTILEQSLRRRRDRIHGPMNGISIIHTDLDDAQGDDLAPQVMNAIRESIKSGRAVALKFICNGSPLPDDHSLIQSVCRSLREERLIPFLHLGHAAQGEVNAWTAAINATGIEPNGSNVIELNIFDLCDVMNAVELVPPGFAAQLSLLCQSSAQEVVA